MKFTSLDTMTRSILLNRGLPMHYYLRYLKGVIDCVRERTMDTLQVTNTVKLTLNSYFAVDLPCDYVDIAVPPGIPQGQLVMPVTQRNSINNLNNFDTQGNAIPYNTTTSVLDFPFFPGYFLFQNTDDIGENLGRLYGLNTGLVNTSYKILRERGQIQFTEDFPSNTIILEYISDGQCIDNASKIDIRAQSMIEAYSVWKNSPNRDNSRSPEADTFGKQWRLCRARIAGTSIQDIRQSMLKSYSQAPKV